MKVELAPIEQAIVSCVGAWRRLSAIKSTRSARHGDPGTRDLWAIDVNGAGAEMALAKFLGIYWGGAGGVPCRVPDVGDLHVRNTPRDDGKLIVHLDEAEREEPFVLVVGSVPCFRIAGWIVPSEHLQGKKPYALRPEYDPSYNVPQSELNDPNALRRRRCR